jgi:bis(5'-nucleosyl)-tetraphosphatase (symmetrical)
MTDYVVGDIQGCFDELHFLLESIQFDPLCDRLISAGDLVNRGPKSLETMRFCKKLGKAFKMVLGNHDLHLLAIAHHVRPPTPKDTITEILDAPDREELITWLQQQPLLMTVDNYTIVHAGIPPQWNLPQALLLAEEVHQVLRSSRAKDYFEHMYGNYPDCWTDDLTGPQRWRVITNYFTRMRFCTAEGKLDLATKNTTEAPIDFHPWFDCENRKTRENNIIFGHWAALQGRDCGDRLFALDTGCVWGGPLRIMNLDTTDYHHSQ